MTTESNQARRDFLKASGLLTGSALLGSLPFQTKAAGNPGYHFSVNDTIKVALIGCGGRGTGAAQQALNTKQNVKIVALADAFRDRLDDAYKALTERGLKAADGSPKVDIPEEHKFVGFDAYKQAMLRADASGLFYSASVDGAPVNWLTDSLLAAGVDLDVLAVTPRGKVRNSAETAKQWRDIWSAGHGVGAVRAIEPAA